MDTSPEYIKMCEKAEEIQKEWKQTEGDFFNGTSGVRVRWESGDWRFASRPSEGDVWLPRQDQLQEIWCEGEVSLPAGLMKLFHDWMYKEKSKLLEFDSFEQLWLAFVMKEKFNKAWNGKEWEKEGD